MKARAKLVTVLIGVSVQCSAWADALSSRIATGMKRDEVIQVFAETPSSIDCSAVAGAEKCTYTWKRGIVQKSIYTVTFVFDRVIAVSVKTESFF